MEPSFVEKVAQIQVGDVNYQLSDAISVAQLIACTPAWDSLFRR